MLRVSPMVFAVILELIQDHTIFTNNSNVPQTPVDVQLAVTLYRLGHYGNAASLEDILCHFIQFICHRSQGPFYTKFFGVSQAFSRRFESSKHVTKLAENGPKKLRRSSLVRAIQHPTQPSNHDKRDDLRKTCKIIYYNYYRR
ncbi:hypothetical protein B0H10DRAFT_1798595 [Mycena sp. CBHHK59/15]|nr:hypothetical protein B0H10DRAFT_1798595 [Mycena sp. CBHHK59/15]